MVEEDQEKILDEATNIVKQQAFHMRTCLDQNNLREALKHSSNMICELRTSTLSPKHYYELYMQVFDELRQLQSHFKEEFRKGRKMSELYESVQHAGNILPRLYLLITVGAVYIETKELPAKDILRDLLEMTKGVQHPTRGLFLRYYLNKMCKDKLPDRNNEYEGEGGTVEDSLDFLLCNLQEMNRLWIRMQHSGSIRDKSKRERERNDLRVTVGENIVRLSNLEGLDLNRYKDLVQPRILEIIATCKDQMAQQYLMDCVIQAFPDEFHLATLDPFLEGCTKLLPQVDLKQIFINLMDRLASFAQSEQIESTGTDIYQLFKKYIDKILEEQKGQQENSKLLELLVAFLRFSMKCYPNSTQNVDLIIASGQKFLAGQNELDQECLKQLVKLLSLPLDTLALQVLSLNNYPKLMQYLQPAQMKIVANRIVFATVQTQMLLDNEDTLTRLIDFIQPVLSGSVDNQTTEFEDEQQNVAKLCHLITNEDANEQLSLLLILFNTFKKGGPERIKFTYPPILMAFLRVAIRQVDTEKILQIANQILEALAEQPELVLRLTLNTLKTLDQVDTEKKFQDNSYDLASQALVIYQDELSDSESKMAALQLITATLSSCKNFEEDSYDTLATNTAQYAAKMLKRPDQAMSVISASHLFTNPNFDNSSRVKECLKKAVKIVDLCQGKNNDLYVHVLNKQLYFEEHVDQSDIQLTLSKINESSDLKSNVFWLKTREYIKKRQEKGELTYISV